MSSGLLREAFAETFSAETFQGSAFYPEASYTLVISVLSLWSSVIAVSIILALLWKTAPTVPAYCIVTTLCTMVKTVCRPQFLNKNQLPSPLQTTFSLLWNTITVTTKLITVITVRAMLMQYSCFVQSLQLKVSFLVKSRDLFAMIDRRRNLLVQCKDSFSAAVKLSLILWNVPVFAPEHPDADS